MRFKDIKRFTSDGNWQADFEIEGLMKFIDTHIKEYDLQLNPDFQRGHVWTEDQQIKWLEFFFRGGRTSRVIYLNKPDWYGTTVSDYNDFVCVDGLQRLTAIRRFINNEIPIFGTYYKDFEDSPSFIRDSISVNINNLQSKAEVLQWYLEMNTGGTPHSGDELEKVKILLQQESQ